MKSHTFALSKPFVCHKLAAALVLPLLPAHAQDKLSVPGKYAGYLPRLYERYQRSSYYVPVRDDTRLGVDLHRPATAPIPPWRKSIRTCPTTRSTIRSAPCRARCRSSCGATAAAGHARQEPRLTQPPAANLRAGSRWQGKLASDKVAVMGHGCGGLQATEASAGPRIKTSVIWSNGIYNRQVAGARDGIKLDKSVLARIHAPIAYINGGPTDIAYAAALDDVSRIKGVPALFAWTSIGHQGTFTVENGGEHGQIGAAWLDWQLKGDAQAGKMFTGAHCGLCRRASWTVTRHAID